MRRKEGSKGEIAETYMLYERQPNVWKAGVQCVLITWDMQADPEGPQVQLRQAERHLIELKQESV